MDAKEYKVKRPEAPVVYRMYQDVDGATIKVDAVKFPQNKDGTWTVTGMWMMQY